MKRIGASIEPVKNLYKIRTRVQSNDKSDVHTDGYRFLRFEKMKFQTKDTLKDILSGRKNRKVVDHAEVMGC